MSIFLGVNLNCSEQMAQNKTCLLTNTRPTHTVNINSLRRICLDLELAPLKFMTSRETKEYEAHPVIVKHFCLVFQEESEEEAADQSGLVTPAET